MGGVSSALVNAINRVGANYGPYEVKIISGLRTGKGESFHGKGQALDVALIDRKTGEKLPNYQNAKNVAAYQQFANAVYADAQKNDPALASRLRWGGYFGNDAGTGKPKYGSFDLMHFDEGGHVGMRGGSWKEGFTPEMQKYWKIPAQAGGVAAAAAGAPGTALNPPANPGVTGPVDADTRRRAFLATIAHGETPGGKDAYRYMLGGKLFDDMSKHPNQLNTSGKYSSTAAGKYQFLGSTWEEQAAKYGYKDFTGDTQDLAAWNYAKDMYKAKAGRDLESDLASDDPKVLNNISSALGQTWTSLPGGSQPNSSWAGKNFADVYAENIKANTAVPEAASADTPLDPTPNVGSGASDYPAANPTNPVTNVYNAPGSDDGGGRIGGGGDTPSEVASTLGKNQFGSNFGSGFGEALAGIGQAFGGTGAAGRGAASAPSSTTVPAAQLPTPPSPVAMIDPRMVEMQRQRLAQAMSRLNSGKLF